MARSVGRVLELVRAGKVHLSGLRVLAAHLTAETADALLDEAIGQSTRRIEEIVARHAPRPAVAESIRKLPTARHPGIAPRSVDSPVPRY